MRTVRWLRSPYLSRRLESVTPRMAPIITVRDAAGNTTAPSGVSTVMDSSGSSSRSRLPYPRRAHWMNTSGQFVSPGTLSPTKGFSRMDAYPSLPSRSVKVRTVPDLRTPTTDALGTRA